MDLGLAPRPLGFGATSVWGWRRAELGLGAAHASLAADFHGDDELGSLVGPGVNSLKFARDKSPGETQ